MSLTTCPIHRCRMPVMDIMDGYDGIVTDRRPVCPQCSVDEAYLQGWIVLAVLAAAAAVVWWLR